MSVLTLSPGRSIRRTPGRTPGARRPHLEQNFGGVLLDDGLWVTTDSEGKISVSSGDLVFSGGLATPAWNDPRKTQRLAAWQVLAGRTWKQHIRQTVTGAAEFGLTASTPIAVDVVLGFYWDGANHYAAVATPTNILLPSTITADTDYIGMVVLTNPGARWYWSVDSGRTWYVVWQRSTGFTSALYAGITNYNLTLRSSYVHFYQGYAKPAFYSGTPTAPVPSLGAELLTDPGLEATYTAGLCASLSIGNGAPTLAESADAHGGTKAQQFTAIANPNFITFPTITVVAGVWYQCSVWAKRTAGAAGQVSMNINGSGGLDTYDYYTSATYALVVRTLRSLGTQLAHRVARQAGVAGFDTVIVDDASVKALTLTSLITLVSDPGTRYGITERAVNCTASYQEGFLAWLDDETAPANYIHAYYDRTAGRAYLLKVVAGVTTELLAVTATYSAGAALRTVAMLDGTTPKVGLYYNNVLMGTIQSITDSGFGTKVALFSTEGVADSMEINVGIGV